MRARHVLLASFYWCFFGCGDAASQPPDAAGVDGGRQTVGLFSEDFEGYANGSNLAGQGGWTGNRTLAGERATLASSVAAGQLDPGSLERAVLTHDLPTFEAAGVLTLTFRAYAYRTLPLSDKSGVFLSAGTDADVGWLASKGAGLVWRFDCRNLTGLVTDFEDVFGGYGEPVALTVVVDFTAGEIYGISDFGEGPREGIHVFVTREQAATLHSVLLVQDYQNPDETLGADFDDIEVTYEGPIEAP